MRKDALLLLAVSFVSLFTLLIIPGRSGAG
jgi:hypothetical protein